jgi:phage tail tape-measure protein
MNNENKKPADKQKGTGANRDPITGTPGAHPVGTGVGATGGGVAGAALGAVAGPVGAAVGLVAGAIAGGLAGKGVAEKIDPTVEDAYWKSNYSKQSYYDRNTPYESYQPAYRTGY